MRVGRRRNLSRPRSPSLSRRRHGRRVQERSLDTVVVSVAHVFERFVVADLVGDALVEDEERVGRVRHSPCARLWLGFESEKANKSAELLLRRNRGLNGLTRH